MTDLKVNQRWRFDDGTNYIVAEIQQLVEDTAICSIVESDYVCNTQYIFAIAIDENSEGIGGLNWQLLVSDIQYGAVCIRCNELYPYAVKATGFRCWSCRNGF